jgi:hypothetical protein
MGWSFAIKFLLELILFYTSCLILGLLAAMNFAISQSEIAHRVIGVCGDIGKRRLVSLPKAYDTKRKGCTYFHENKAITT